MSCRQLGGLVGQEAHPHRCPTRLHCLKRRFGYSEILRSAAAAENATECWHIGYICI